LTMPILIDTLKKGMNVGANFFTVMGEPGSLSIPESFGHRLRP
jgi:hypothetical protein